MVAVWQKAKESEKKNRNVEIKIALFNLLIRKILNGA